MDLGLKGRRALVTGASQGIGKAVAEALAAEGATVGIAARNAAKLAEVAKSIGGMAFRCDLSVDGAPRQLVRDFAEKMGGIDVLVLSTGGPPRLSFDAIEDAAWRSAFEALWMSTVQAIREALPHMRANRWGRIILVTSTAAREPIPNLFLSNSLRAGLHGFVNALSKEVAADGITVNALMPGMTATDRLKELGSGLDQLAQRVPAKRIGEPAEFAALAAFIASAKAAYVTGQAIACDGGLLQSI